MHSDPEAAQEARRRGGKGNIRFRGVPLPSKVRLRTPADLMHWQEFIFEGLLSGKIPTATANAASYLLAGGSLDYERHILDERLAKLETMMEEKESETKT
jgi:hypothetical protein